MSKKKQELTVPTENQIDEAILFEHISSIIENRKFRAQIQANQECVLMFWEIGKYISSVFLGGEPAGYGKQIVVTLAQQLQKKYGSSFESCQPVAVIPDANYQKFQYMNWLLGKYTASKVSYG
ncbi:MAG: DUF1016 N-terminal domain-containing protein [Peptococcaceae bacterium]|nr:DUF1016 N-terminal domain-containing protein [Peptococcaceae bacterium]